MGAHHIVGASSSTGSTLSDLSLCRQQPALRPHPDAQLSLAAKPENNTQLHPNIIPGGVWKIEHSGSSRGFPTFYTLFNYGDELPSMVVNHDP